MVKLMAAKAAGKWSFLPGTAVCDECWAELVQDELRLHRGTGWIWGKLRFGGFFFFKYC